jgi:AraC family transcriptional regulator of adaptative response / DNA-3-methyladenine glycosylase II
VRAVLGQQVTVAGARTLAARLVEQLGVELDDGTRLFPTAQAIAAVDHDTLAMPRSRARALTGLATALAEGTLALDRGEDRTDVRRRLLALDGIGPWTADYIAMRALGDPDVFLAGDVGVRHALGLAARDAQARAEGWRPWRSYALMHLWHTPTLGDRQER